MIISFTSSHLIVTSSYSLHYIKLHLIAFPLQFENLKNRFLVLFSSHSLDEKIAFFAIKMNQMINF